VLRIASAVLLSHVTSRTHTLTLWRLAGSLRELRSSWYVARLSLPSSSVAASYPSLRKD
jgi:hypothetical protein